MPDPHAGDHLSGSTVSVGNLAAEVRAAERHAYEAAYASHRSRVHSQLGIPLYASRGQGGCLALVLLPLGLILLTVHPLPAILVLVVVGWLHLSGSERLRQERSAIDGAYAEALRLWREAGNPPPQGIGADDGGLVARLPPPTRP
jgi:hypothetical protein